jgi:hypothetical protein
LAEEEKLGQDADGFEDYGENPGDLSLISFSTFILVSGKQTSTKPHSYFVLKINITIGAPTALPTKHTPPSFHAFSLSLVRAYTLSIINKM